MKDELGPLTGKELAPEPELDTPPLWQPRLTGIQTLDALGCQVERHRDRSSGTERDRQWRFGGGGGGELWKALSVKETSGLWRGSPEWERGHRASSSQESSRRLALDDRHVAELVSENVKRQIRQISPLMVLNAACMSMNLPCLDLQALHETVGLEPTAGND